MTAGCGIALLGAGSYALEVALMRPILPSRRRSSAAAARFRYFIRCEAARKRRSDIANALKAPGTVDEIRLAFHLIYGLATMRLSFTMRLRDESMTRSAMSRPGTLCRSPSSSISPSRSTTACSSKRCSRARLAEERSPVGQSERGSAFLAFFGPGVDREDRRSRAFSRPIERRGHRNGLADQFRSRAIQPRGAEGGRHSYHSRGAGIPARPYPSNHARLVGTGFERSTLTFTIHHIELS